MSNRKVWIFFGILLSAGLIIGAYTLTADNPDRGLAALKAVLIFIIALLIILLWFILRIYMLAASKTFFTDKRNAARIYGDITAKIINKDFEGKVNVLNAGYRGALLRSARDILTGTVLEIKMFLPLFPQPIDVKAKVLRSVAKEEEGKGVAFDIGIEYTEISNIDREKLIETLDALLARSTK